MYFPVSDVETAVWVPPVVGFVISFFTSMGGISGAFLILPFQMSVLGFTTPAVTPTNLVFNVVGIPGSVYRYFKEGRMNWPLAWNIIVGTIPGLIFGLFIRVWYLPDPRAFKLFVGCVLFYIGGRMLFQLISERGDKTGERAAEIKMRQQAAANSAGTARPAIRNAEMVPHLHGIRVFRGEVQFPHHGSVHACACGGAGRRGLRHRRGGDHCAIHSLFFRASGSHDSGRHTYGDLRHLCWRSDLLRVFRSLRCHAGSIRET